jgi:glycerate 2-kinase
LLASGAAIREINCVRRHMSRFKGGRLAAAAAPAQLVTLTISDVAGNQPVDIASGPTVADPSTIADAKAVLARYGVSQPGRWCETVKRCAGDYYMVASGNDTVTAAAAATKALGYKVKTLSCCEGEARIVAHEHAAIVHALVGDGLPAALISGGELTVSVKGNGRGGPNQEYALALALALNGLSGIAALAADTDGIDGNGMAAGAFIDSGTLARARAAGLDAEGALAGNDSGSFFASLGDLFVTGPTGTNVNDLRILLFDPRLA